MILKVVTEIGIPDIINLPSYIHNGQQTLDNRYALKRYTYVVKQILYTGFVNGLVKQIWDARFMRIWR